jgi:tripartite-type tricarboxylate transporter receptor subunit TctC
LGTAATAGAMEKAGRVRFIAMAGPRRHAAYPLVPSTAETPALAGYEIAAWTGLFAPRGTPAPLRERLSSDLARALATAEVIERYRAVGYELFDLNPQAMAQMIADDTRKWGDVIRKTGLRLE